MRCFVDHPAISHLHLLITTASRGLCQADVVLRFCLSSWEESLNKSGLISFQMCVWRYQFTRKQQLQLGWNCPILYSHYGSFIRTICIMYSQCALPCLYCSHLTCPVSVTFNKQWMCWTGTFPKKETRFQSDKLLITYSPTIVQSGGVVVQNRVVNKIDFSKIVKNWNHERS